MDLVTLLGALGIVGLRIADVALGTVRIAMLVRGRPLLAGALSFAESLVWLLAAAQVLSNLGSPVQFVAYALGYALGTVIGVTIERWIAIGDVLMRVVSRTNTPSVAPALREAGFVVTELNAKGRDGGVTVAFSVMPRRRVPKALAIVRKADPDAFASFESTTQYRQNAVVPATRLRK